MTFASKVPIAVSKTANSSSDFLYRQCACGARTSGGRTCSECQSREEEQSSSSVLRRSAISSKTTFGAVPPVAHDVFHKSESKQIQRKLIVNQPGDKYEQEADQIAEQVMRMPDRKQLSVNASSQISFASGNTNGPQVFRQTVPASPQPRVPTHALEPIQPKSANQLSDAVAANFRNAARDVQAATGYDISANVGDATRAIGFKTQKVGASNFTWHKTGRAVDLPQGLPWVVVEDPASQTSMQFRLFLPAAMTVPNSPPDGGTTASSQPASHLTQHRFTRRPKSQDILLDGKLVTINGGFPGNKIFTHTYIDVTTVLEKQGFSRIEAQPGWANVPTKQEWWHYERRDGKNYFTALQELYSDADIEAGFKNVVSGMTAAQKTAAASRLRSEGFPDSIVDKIVPPPPVPQSPPQPVRRSSHKPGPAIAPPTVHSAINKPGQPLDSTTRKFFEPRFGHDLSHIRIHTGSVASQSAAEVNAIAYTVGNDIVFADGQFQPNLQSGRKLLAHELTHTIQQGHFPLSADLTLAPDETATSATLEAGCRSPTVQLQRQAEVGLRLAPSTGLSKEQMAEIAALRRYFNLPVAPTNSDPRIVGILILPDGSKARIHSGTFGGPDGGTHRGHIPRGTSSGFDRFTTGHVEGHAAAIMHERNISSATLLIEKEFCPNCDRNLSQMLPPGSKLDVVTPDSITGVRSSTLRSPVNSVMKDVSLKDNSLSLPQGMTKGPTTKSPSVFKSSTRITIETGDRVASSTTSARKITPAVKTGSFSAEAQAITHSATASSSSEIRMLRAARWMTNGIQLLSVLDNLKMYSDFSAMATSGLTGQGFVLTNEIRQARETERESRRTLQDYLNFSTELTRKQLSLLSSLSDPRAAGQAAFQLGGLAADIAKLKTGFERQLPRLIATAAEANSKGRAALEILKDPHATSGLGMAGLGSGELAQLYGCAEDFQQIRGALNAAVSNLDKMLIQLRVDEDFIMRWYQASISVCEQGGVCKLPKVEDHH